MALPYIVQVLGLTYSKHFSSADWANTLSRWTFVPHGNRLRVLDLNLLSAFHAIRLHFEPPFT